MMISRSVLFTAVSFAAWSQSADAILASNAILDFDDAVNGCVAGIGTYPDCAYGTTVTSGSYFGMDASGDEVIQEGERQAIISAGTGFAIGTAQNVGEIDQEWFYGGNPGYHYTNSDGGVTVPTLISASGNTASIDMSGWTIYWNGGDIRGDHGWGGRGVEPVATVTCDVDCGVGDRFVLDYESDVGSYYSFYYTLHLEGVVAAVPVPAAFWLFLSGVTVILSLSHKNKKTRGGAFI